MTPPTKEAMEKARELTDKFFNHESSPKYFEDGDIPKWIGYLMESIATEFTNYQKRVEELEKLWTREAGQYQKQIEECRTKNLPHDCMLGHMTALRQCAKAIKSIL